MIFFFQTKFIEFMSELKSLSAIVIIVAILVQTFFLVF